MEDMSTLNKLNTYISITIIINIFIQLKISFNEDIWLYIKTARS